eukprot:TRINITY_DN112927_c0_g1_i1.p1 TRINITY_DN112927_c0_g1~~TRINITY_DN112927_c0_g1_i1.p1  ORF type:complete len:506 (+),score=64.02 TRINITY_DN112927_c0_g1_i1:71-1588(+)
MAGLGDCCLCMQPLVAGTCIQCNALDGSAHGICDDCFVAHVEHLDQRRFHDHAGRVPCPAEGWHGSWYADEDLASVYVRRFRPRELERYLANALPRQHGEDQNVGRDGQEQHFANQILEAVNIRCPHAACQHVVELNPDGCRAMTCGMCGCHFCWVCFHISPDSGANHAHVIQQHGDLFLAQNLVDEAHRHWRRQQVVNFMRAVPDELRAGVIERARDHLVALDPVLIRAAAFDEGVPILDPANIGDQVNVNDDSPFQKMFVGCVAAAKSITEEAVTKEVTQTVFKETTETVMKEVTETAMKEVTETVMKEVAETVVGESIIHETVTKVIKRPKPEKILRKLWHHVNSKCSTGDKVIKEIIEKKIPTETVITTLVPEEVTKLVPETVTKLVPETTTQVVPQTLTKTVCEQVATVTVKGAALGAARASVAWDFCLVNYDVGRQLTGWNAPQDMRAQLRNRCFNASCNLTGNMVGAAVGTALLPGPGTFIGTMVGGVFAALHHREVQ